jgi:hypothetical protein
MAANAEHPDPLVVVANAIMHSLAYLAEVVNSSKGEDMVEPYPYTGYTVKRYPYTINSNVIRLLIRTLAFIIADAATVKVAGERPAFVADKIEEIAGDVKLKGLFAIDGEEFRPRLAGEVNTLLDKLTA